MSQEEGKEIELYESMYVFICVCITMELLVYI